MLKIYNFPSNQKIINIIIHTRFYEPIVVCSALDKGLFFFKAYENDFSMINFEKLFNRKFYVAKKINDFR